LERKPEKETVLIACAEKINLKYKNNSSLAQRNNILSNRNKIVDEFGMGFACNKFEIKC
jgi:hypothetical protein